jgi:hypothetical protein
MSEGLNMIYDTLDFFSGKKDAEKQMEVYQETLEAMRENGDEEEVQNE